MNKDTPSTTPSGTEPVDARFEQFQQQINELQLSAGGAAPERTSGRIGIALGVVGAVMTVVWGFIQRGDSEAVGTNAQLVEVINASNNLWIALAGIAFLLVGLAVWLRNSLTRYLRYWLLRELHESTTHADRVVAAIRELGESNSKP